MVYTTEEVAKMLKVVKQTIENEIKRGKLKRLKIGARVLIRKTDLEAYLEEASK